MLHASQGSGRNPLPAAQTSLDPFRTLFRRPGDYEPIGFLNIYLYVCLFVYVCVTVCLRMHLCVSACVHVQ